MLTKGSRDQLHPLVRHTGLARLRQLTFSPPPIPLANRQATLKASNRRPGPVSLPKRQRGLQGEQNARTL
jgi:hypothetical protein